jgi:lactate 2-monooxygenase
LLPCHGEITLYKPHQFQYLFGNPCIPGGFFPTFEAKHQYFAPFQDLQPMLKALDWQTQIYLSGFGGKVPEINPDWVKLEAAAAKKMSPAAASYIIGGAGLQDTMRSNRSDFDAYKILPRMLRDVSDGNTNIELFGQKFSSPFWLCPIGVLEMVHPEADKAVAKAAAACGIPYVFSNQASVPMETCAAAMGAQPRFFQLYWSKSRDLVASFVKRAEACGCAGIILTLDTTLLGWRTRDLEIAFLPFLQGKGVAQYTSDPVFQAMLDAKLAEGNKTPRPKLSYELLNGLISAVKRYPGSGFVKKLRSGRPMAAVQLFVQTYSNPAITWDDLAFLRNQTSLPIILKGILHPDDASKALDYGMDGIVVSNHGGRQVDGSISAIGALPGVVKAVDRRVPVILDSGIRGGADVFKALALGASAVGLGRPYVYGLTLGGEQGVYQVLRHLMSDFELTMRLAGCRSISEISLDNLQ